MATKLQGTAGGMRIYGEGKRRREGSLIHVLDVATICVAKVSNGGDKRDQRHYCLLVVLQSHQHKCDISGMEGISGNFFLWHEYPLRLKDELILMF